MNITFEKAQLKHKESIFNWLAEPHVKEFWDNSQEHKDDIVKFINGRTEASSYFDGLYNYWIGTLDNEPFCLIMTIKEGIEYNLPTIKQEHISKTGSTYSIDYLINKKYFGKGLGAQTLEAFINFLHSEIDPSVDTFFIDPDITNPRAKHIYEKAGFKHIGDFVTEGGGVFKGRRTHFLVKQLLP